MGGGATSVLDVGSRVLLVWREPTPIRFFQCRVVLASPGIVNFRRLVGVGIASTVLVALAVVVLVVSVATVATLGCSGSGSSCEKSSNIGLHYMQIKFNKKIRKALRHYFHISSLTATNENQMDNCQNYSSNNSYNSI